MFWPLTHGLVALLYFGNGVTAACSSPLLIDNFSTWASNSNTLGLWTSDDSTLPSASASSRVLSFQPRNTSYFYETIPCQEATSNGYDSIQFTVKGPPAGQMTLEMQARPSCAESAAPYQSFWFTVKGLTGSKQSITVPLSSFRRLNTDAITAFVWGTFLGPEAATWEFSQIQLGCGALSKSSSATQISSATTSLTVSSLGSLAAAPRSNSPSPNIIAEASTVSPVAEAASTSVSGQCSNLLIDDWASQSRLTFLFYNAMLQASSDDGTFKSITVKQNRVTLTPNSDSYFFSQFGCLNVEGTYGGISLRIKAPRRATFKVELSSTSQCGGGNTANIGAMSFDLGWFFDGAERLYYIPFSSFAGLDISKITGITFSNLNGAIVLGPMSFYCGNTVSEYIVSATAISVGPTPTIPAPAGTAAKIVVDRFSSNATNALGFWHGADDGMVLTWGTDSLTIVSPDPDYSFYTQLSVSCRDMSSYDTDYLHISYSGSNAFTIALQQHNSNCNENIAPFPETWDSVEAARYASATDIYIPLSHFNIIKSRVVGISLKGFYKTDPVVLTAIEIVQSVPVDFKIPTKLPSGNLIFSCKRPNSFAFAIDDGDPQFAQQVMKTIRDAGIKVTFFTVGAPLLDPSTNLSNVYNEMAAQGHQIALHSYTHPKMEGLPDYESIDWEYNNDISAVAKQLNNLHTPYFRPPFGTEGARMRQRLAVATGNANPYVVNWSVDVQDWIWAMTDTPQKQLDAFQNDLNKGGNLVVMHYLYKSTVDYLPQFIDMAKKTGKELMRVDQCMEDPNAPPL